MQDLWKKCKKNIIILYNILSQGSPTSRRGLRKSKIVHRNLYFRFLEFNFHFTKNFCDVLFSVSDQMLFKRGGDGVVTELILKLFLGVITEVITELILKLFLAVITGVIFKVISSSYL